MGDPCGGERVLLMRSLGILGVADVKEGEVFSHAVPEVTLDFTTSFSSPLSCVGPLIVEAKGTVILGTLGCQIQVRSL